MTASARRSVFHGAVSWSSWFPRAVPQTWTLVSDFGVHISPELKGPFPNSEILRSWSKVSGQTENTNRNRTGAQSPTSSFLGAREQAPQPLLPGRTSGAAPDGLSPRPGQQLSDRLGTSSPPSRAHSRVFFYPSRPP